MSTVTKKDLELVLKQINVPKNVIMPCIFFNDLGYFLKNKPVTSSTHWDLFCLLLGDINASLERGFPYYNNVYPTSTVINDMKIRQLLEYYKVNELRPDNVTTFLFLNTNINDGLILDYIYHLRYDLSIINPSKYESTNKIPLLSDQLIMGTVDFSEFYFLHIFIQYKHDNNIIENIKKNLFRIYTLIKLNNTTSLNIYLKKLGMKKDEMLSSQENRNKFIKLLLDSKFYKKEFSSFIDPIILDSLQWLNNLPNNTNFTKYKNKRSKDIRLFKFNFKETFGNQRLFEKEKIINEIKKTRKLLKLPSISYE